MKKIGIGVDYSNICKKYNTVYLDRDNTDPETSKCMKQVLSWTKSLLVELIEHFNFKIYNLNSGVSAEVDDIAAKRFLFYSLEKEITLQSYVLQQEALESNSTVSWEAQENESILIQNDEDGGSLYFFVSQNSKEHAWMLEKLKNFSLDEVTLELK